MANPIPLTSPQGVLYGFACGSCNAICAHASRGGRDRTKPSNIELSMGEAMRCCTCRTCGKVRGCLDFAWTDMDLYCPVCKKADELRIKKAMRKEKRSTKRKDPTK